MTGQAGNGVAGDAGLSRAVFKRVLNLDAQQRLAVVHVFGHQDAGASSFGGSQNVCVIKRNLMRLCNLHSLRVRCCGQRFNLASGFDYSQQIMDFGPVHLEFAKANGCDFIEHLNTDAGGLGEQTLGCVGFARVDRQQVQDDVAVQKNPTHLGSLASSRSKWKSAGNLPRS
jgi:hypothetical protein